MNPIGWLKSVADGCQQVARRGRIVSGLCEKMKW